MHLFSDFNLEKKAFISKRRQARLALTVTADVALLAPFGVEERAVSTVRAEVSHRVRELSKASTAVRWPHRLSGAVAAVIASPCTLNAHTVSAVTAHVLVEALGDGVWEAEHTVLSCALLLAAPDAFKLVSHFVETF